MSDKMHSVFESVFDQILSSHRNIAKMFLGIVCIVIMAASSAVWLSELWVVPALDARITASDADPVPATTVD